MRKNVRRIWEHVLFWLLYWLLISISTGLYDFDFFNVAFYNLSRLPLTIFSTYVFIYRILPVLLEQKRAGFFVLASVGLLLATVFLDRLSIQYIQFPIFYANSEWSFTFFDWYRISGFAVHLVTTVGIVSGFKYYRDWQRAQRKMMVLSQEKREAELNYLKAQIHPHFLFNTLNAIYYEAIQQSEKTPELIIHLSELLRFSLYLSKDERIPVGEEIKVIESYIELQKCRYGDRLKVQMNCALDVDNIQIPPLLCFSLVENAFKHGVSESTGESLIRIDIELRDARIVMQVVNPKSQEHVTDPFGAAKGIGLKNTRRQLSLLFGNDFELRTESKLDQFICTLEIPIQIK